MASELPPRCIPIEEWAHGEAVDDARLLASERVDATLRQIRESGEEFFSEPDITEAFGEWYRLDREDWLEAYCLGINAYREAASEP